jgi:hypothetical protein
MKDRIDEFLPHVQKIILDLDLLGEAMEKMRKYILTEFWLEAEYVTSKEMSNATLVPEVICEYFIGWILRVGMNKAIFGGKHSHVENKDAIKGLVKIVVSEKEVSV